MHFLNKHLVLMSTDIYETFFAVCLSDLHTWVVKIYLLALYIHLLGPIKLTTPCTRK